MKKLPLLMALAFLLLSLSGCNTASLMTGMTGTSYSSARMLAAYPDAEIIRDQDRKSVV